MFALDRDLLVLEPTLFRDVAWVGQRLLAAPGSVSASVLTITGGDFNAAGVEPGCVVMYDALPLEVTAVTAGNRATVSLLRADVAGPTVPPPELGSRPIVAASFRPQLSLMHAQVLRLLGIEPGVPATPGGGSVTEARIVNPRGLWLVEALGALNLIYSAAAALTGAGSPLAERAELYRRLFGEERRLVSARVDTDGDGVADATRRMNVGLLRRG